MKKLLTVILTTVLAVALPVAASAQTSTDKRAELREHKETADAQGEGMGRSNFTPLDTTCGTDPAGDTAPAPFGRADIVGFCADYEPATVHLLTEVAQASDPRTDPNWLNGITGSLSDIDIDGDAEPEYQIFFMNIGGLNVDVVRVSDDQQLCQGAASVSGSTFIASFPASCIGSPAAFAASSFMAYDSQWDDPEAPVYADLGPTVAVSASQTEPEPDPIVNPPSPGEPRVRATQRLAGPSRIETAVAISEHGFPSGADAVYLARADAFPDALAASALSDGPILLVPRCDGVPAAVAAEIDRLDPARVVALGGEAAICAATLRDAAS